jgi:hypothetical protein
MFRNPLDPSSGSNIQYIAENYNDGKIVPADYGRCQHYGSIYWPMVCVCVCVSFT